MRLKVAYPDNWVDNFKGLKMDKKGFLMNLMVLAGSNLTTTTLLEYLTILKHIRQDQ
jgi:hypothetical protein